MSKGSVVLNKRLLDDIMRRDGHAFSDFDDSAGHTNKSTVSKNTWKRACHGDPIRRNSWLDIAAYLDVAPPDLLLAETKTNYDDVVNARRSCSTSIEKASNIVVTTEDIGTERLRIRYEHLQTLTDELCDGPRLTDTGRG